jgi:6-phosphogluconolactonase
VRANVELHRCTDAAALAAALADDVARRLGDAAASRGRALLAVSGGASPLPLYAALRTRALPWQRVSVILVDERCVPPEHADSNAALVRRHLLRDAAAAADWQPMFDALPAALDGGDGADDADDAGSAHDPALEALARQACRRLAGAPWPVDVAVLGMGEDGHTASLFAAARGLEHALRDPGPVAWTRPATAPHARLTLTLPVLLDARCLVLPLVGAAKRRVFDRACEAPSDELPVSLLLHRAERPVQVWIADA